MQSSQDIHPDHQSALHPHAEKQPWWTFISALFAFKIYMTSAFSISKKFNFRERFPKVPLFSVKFKAFHFHRL